MNMPSEEKVGGTGMGGYKPSQASPTKSARRSIAGKAMAGGSSEVGSSIDNDNRPPVYVPTRRDSREGRGVGLRDSLNGGQKNASYQPKT